MTNEYVQGVEKENEMLRKKLLHYDTLRDIITTKVLIDNINIGEMVEPQRLCDYMVKLGWTLNYEKTHERYLTRSYFSPHRDTKCKLYIRDLRPDPGGHGAKGLRSKLVDAVRLLARLHKKGELEVIYEVITGDVKETTYDKNAKFK
jgi:hypothetical protein